MSGVHPSNVTLRWGDTLGSMGALAAEEVADRRAWKQPCRVATTGNVTIATALNAGDTIDGVTLAAGDRVLVWQNTAQEENGIIVAGVTPARSSDADTDPEIRGAMVMVLEGTTHGGKLFRNTNTAAITIDTDPITFEEFAAAGSAVAPFDHGAMGATETFDLADGTWHRATWDDDCTITVQGFTVDMAAVMLVEFTIDAFGGHSASWDPDMIFGGNDQPPQAADAYGALLIWTSAGDSEVRAAWIGSTAFGTPAVVLGTAAADGVAETMLRTDATIVAFDDATPQALGTAAPGTAAFAARSDHVHPGSSEGAHENIVDVFDGDAVTTAFEISQEPIDPEEVFAFVGGSWTAVTVSGAMNTTVTFGSAPASGTGNVVIQYPAVVA